MIKAGIGDQIGLREVFLLPQSGNCNLTKEEKAMYDVELKRKWDRANILAYAREQGKEEGLAEGEAKGKAETEAKKNYEFVSNLLQAGRFSIEEIAKYANVPASFVHEVQKKLSKKNNHAQVSKPSANTKDLGKKRFVEGAYFLILSNTSFSNHCRSVSLLKHSFGK